VTYSLLKYLHVIGATVILGTGSGIAFFMLMAHLSRDAAFVARTAGMVVLADVVFTATAVTALKLTRFGGAPQAFAGGFSDAQDPSGLSA